MTCSRPRVLLPGQKVELEIGAFRHPKPALISWPSEPVLKKNEPFPLSWCCGRLNSLPGEGAVVDEGGIQVHVRRRRQVPSLGEKAETGTRVVVRHGRDDGRTEHVGVLTLPDRGRARLIHRGLLRARDAGRPAELLLVPAEVEDRRAVGFERLEVQLSGVVVEVRRVRRSPELRQRDLLAAVAAPEPRAVLPERAARLDAVVLDSGGPALAADGADAVHLVVQIARIDRGPVESQVRLLLRLLRRVVGLQLSRRVEVARGAVRLVGAALRDHVQRHARHGDRGIGASRGHLDFLELVEVVIRRGRAERGHVGDRDAVHVEGVLARVGSHPDVGGLLSALAAGDVQAVHLHSRHLLDDDPRVAPGRNALQFRQLVVRAGDALARVDQGHLARHGHRRRDRGELHRDREIRVLTQVHDDIVALDGGESLKGRDDLVRADGQVQEMKLSLGIRERRLGRSRTRRRQRHAGQDAPLFVHHPSVDVSRARLSQRERGREQESRGHGTNRDLPHRHASSFSMRALVSTTTVRLASVRSRLIEGGLRATPLPARRAGAPRTRVILTPDGGTRRADGARAPERGDSEFRAAHQDLGLRRRHRDEHAEMLRGNGGRPREPTRRPVPILSGTRERGRATRREGRMPLSRGRILLPAPARARIQETGGAARRLRDAQCRKTSRPRLRMKLARGLFSS